MTLVIWFTKPFTNQTELVLEVPGFFLSGNMFTTRLNYIFINSNIKQFIQSILLKRAKTSAKRHRLILDLLIINANYI